MGRISLIVPGAAAPDLWSLDAWRAMSGSRLFGVEGDPVATALMGGGLKVELLSAPVAPVRGHPPSAPGGEMTGARALPMAGPIGGSHGHGEVGTGVRAVAEHVADASADGDVALLEHDESLRRAVLTVAIERGLEVELIVGRQPLGHELLRVVQTMAFLHGPDGCPWDREQTHETLAKNLLDECYELLDAIETGGPDELRDELGDLLLQVVFHAQMAVAQGTFDIDDVAAGLDAKLKRRHPHVFEGLEVEDSHEVVRNWDQIKREEKGELHRVFDGVAAAMPALAYAQKLVRRAEAAGLDEGSPADAATVIDRAHDLLAPHGDPEDEIGALLFAAVRQARRLGVDAESALRRAARRYREAIEAKEDA